MENIIFCFFWIYHLLLGITMSNTFAHNIAPLDGLTQYTKLFNSKTQTIKSILNGKIKYTNTKKLNNLFDLCDSDLLNTYTIIGSKTNIKCNRLMKKLNKMNKQFIFMDETLYEKNSIEKIVDYYKQKQKIDLSNTKKPWLFYETTYIQTNNKKLK